jgi:pimeloyl-ACP methyl ester carboxylesterase
MIGVVLLLLAQAADGGASEPTTPALELISRTTEAEYVEQLLDDGKHVRFGSKDFGPVHVWRPRAYRSDTAVTVVYLHGFFTSVDQAVRAHQLITQFRDSGRNGLFIIPEARSWRTDPVFWPDLEKLLAAVEKRLKLKRPKGNIVLVGHSGGYRTIAGWLSHENVKQVLLIDGLYGNEPEFKAWLDEPPGPRQLVLVGYDTQQRAEWMLRKRTASVQLDTLPWLYDELPPSIRNAPLVSVQSERLDHMQLVTDGRLIPWLLHSFRNQ